MFAGCPMATPLGCASLAWSWLEEEKDKIKIYNPLFLHHMFIAFKLADFYARRMISEFNLS